MPYIETDLRGNKMYRPYKNWSEEELRNGIWQLANRMSIPGGYTDIELLRIELSLSSEGYHDM